MADRTTPSGAARRLLVAQLAIVLVCCGCSASCSVGTVPAAGGNESVTQSPIPPQLAPALLSAAEVAALPGAPADGLARIPIDQTAASETTHTEAPCGTPIEEPSPRTGAAELFENASAQIYVWVTHPSGGEARRLLAASIADARRSCPDHNFTTSTGLTERIHFYGTLPLPGIGEQVLATHMRVSDHDFWLVLIRRGEYLDSISANGPQSFSPEFISALAATADRHLARVAG
jgi:hypothetical protein